MRAARRIRQQKGLTLREVERITGIDRGNLSRFEQGRTGMLLGNLTVYACCLGVSIDDLLRPMEGVPAEGTERPTPPAERPAFITAADHPVLARLWDNDADAVYDTL